MKMPTRLLVIDDDKLLLQGVVEIFKREGYETLSAANGKLGVQLALEHSPHLIVCDMMMPPPDGVQVIKELAANPATASIPFIYLTARAGESNIIQGLELGADDYISKPFTKGELLARVRAVLRRISVTQEDERKKAKSQIESMRGMVGELVQKHSADHAALAKALSDMLALRDHITEEHGRRVVELSERVARKLSLGEEEVMQIRIGALLHDIGKVGIPDAILHKPGALNEEEKRIMQRHAILGFEIAKSIGLTEIASGIIHYHHEHWNGNGYPDGIQGISIPVSARIFAVVDVWDALTSDRPYRKAWTEEQAREFINSQAGSQFDPQVVLKFLQLLDP